ncbi:hypothetical protein CAPTEDRAFT_205303 [Capitella teleta]|uniref:Uncharacterized protein n=1 Tax=Capitella teleta TaxID=283909 RepID=R7TTE9_CAPTE|nr:hypothetical protein CAPTEDRAFT_205303 [Capitella teleta]|eukprot:ELT94751.1 hypothetical protein CAPTEDRAFT_205303 [Capitella teleta]
MHQTTYNSNRSRGIRGSHTDQPVYQIDPNTDSQWFRKAEVDSYHGLSSTAKIEAIESCMDNDVLKMYNPYRYVSPNFMQRTNYELFKESLEELKMLTVVAVADTILPLVKEPLESSETVLNAWSKMHSLFEFSLFVQFQKNAQRKQNPGQKLQILHRLLLPFKKKQAKIILDRQMPR